MSHAEPNGSSTSDRLFSGAGSFVVQCLGVKRWSISLLTSLGSRKERRHK